MKFKQLILAAIFIVSCFSIGFAQTDRDKGIELFNKGDFQGAVDVLSKVGFDSSPRKIGARRSPTRPKNEVYAHERNGDDDDCSD